MTNDFAPLTGRHLLNVVSRPSDIIHTVLTFDSGSTSPTYFRHRWQKEYLYTLQARDKWQRPDRNLAVDFLVIIKELTSPFTRSTAKHTLEKTILSA